MDENRTTTERTPTDGARGRPGEVAARPGGARTDPEMSRRDELDKIVPGPGHSAEVDELVRERMEEESPDGRPPTLAGRRKSRILFFTAMAVIWIVVLGALYWIGGTALAALALVLSVIYIGYAAWPTWRAALERRADEHRAEREIDTELHPPGSVPPPPQHRQPPSE